MMKILLAFIVLLAAVALGIQLHHDSGYLMIAINHWTIETTLSVAVFGLIITFMLLYFFLQFFHQLILIPEAIRSWYNKYQSKKAQDMTRKGFIEYGEGHWSKAKNYLIKALPHADAPFINYITAARAAQKMGNNGLRDKYLQQAQQCMPEAKVAVELTQAKLQLADQQWEQALSTLKNLQSLAPQHPYVLKLLMKLYEEMRDWEQLILLLPSIKKNQVIGPKEFEQFQLKIYLQALTLLAKKDQSTEVISFFNALPNALANHPQLLAEYVHFLIRNQSFTIAEGLLRRTLRKNVNDQLIELYGLLPAKENQLHFAESLLKKNPQSAPLHLCLGRICKNLNLWGKAKYYFEQSTQFNPSPITYYELAKMHDKLNESSQASINYKKGLILANK
ncbi:MAG: protoporphyrinogen oxidase [Legionella sp.]|nr:protoporphyrinogen oxidase [Legionella sp.]